MKTLQRTLAACLPFNGAVTPLITNSAPLVLRQPASEAHSLSKAVPQSAAMAFAALMEAFASLPELAAAASGQTLQPVKDHGEAPASREKIRKDTESDIPPEVPAEAKDALSDGKYLGPVPVSVTQQEPLPMDLTWGLPLPQPSTAEPSRQTALSPQEKLPALASPQEKRTSIAAPRPESFSAQRAPEASPTDHATQSEPALEVTLIPHDDLSAPHEARHVVPQDKEKTEQSTIPHEAPPPASKSESQNDKFGGEPQRPADRDRGQSQQTTPRTDHHAEPFQKTSEQTVTVTAPAHSLKPLEGVKPSDRPAPLATSASDIPELAAPRTEPARDISLRIGSAHHDAVDVQLTERGGQIHVAVRSADATMTRSLQDNVTELAGKLERAGFHTETSLPNRSEAAREPQANPNFQDSPRDRRAPQYEQPRLKRTSRSAQSTFEISMPQNEHQETK